MISTKSDKCKDRTWCWSCDMCQIEPFLCFVCKETITYRERHDHMDIHFNDPNQNLLCKKCQVKKHIPHYGFKHFTCRLCLYHNRYRFGCTKNDL